MVTLKCPDDLEIDLFLDGELGPERSAALMRHLEGCHRCRERVEAEKRFREVLKLIPVVHPPREFSDHLVNLSRRWVLEGSDSGRRSLPVPVRQATFPQLLGRLVSGAGVRRALAWTLTVVAIVMQIRAGVFVIGGGLWSLAPGLDVLDEAASFMQGFSLGEFARYVSGVREAFRTGGCEAALIAVKALFGTETLLYVALGLAFIVVVALRKRRLRLSWD